MRPKTFTRLLLALLLASRAGAAQAVLAITHVTVIDMTGAPPRPDLTVVITGNRITSIGNSAPKGAQIIDASGKFLIPGLWDMHAHLSDKEYLPLFLANGVTGVRVMWGAPEHHEWRTAIEAGHLIGPRMVIASAIVDGPKPYWQGSISVSTEAQARQVVTTVKQNGADFVKVYQNLPRDLYFAIADESRKQGIPFAGHVPLSVSAEEASNAGQKSFEHLVGILPACSTRSDELLKAQQDDLAEGIAAGRPAFWGPRVKQSRQMMLDTYSQEKASALSALLKRNGTWQCPTLTLLHMFGYGDDPSLRDDPRLKYVPVRTRAGWNPAAIDGIHTPKDFAYGRREFRKDLEVVGAMQRAGVGILAGTDTQNPFCFTGFGLHDELGFLVQAGLTPLEALRAATLNPAHFLEREKDWGTVETGKIADLLLLNANPLDDIGNTRKIASVIYDGRFLSRASLDQMLANVEAMAARQPIGEVLFKTIQEKDGSAAVAQFHDLKATQPAAYDFSESELIGLGYHLIAMKKYKDAIAIFKLSVETYPQSYNTWDSLAEACMDDGEKDLAIANYKKSLQLNPGNTNAVKKLKDLNAH